MPMRAELVATKRERSSVSCGSCTARAAAFERFGSLLWIENVPVYRLDERILFPPVSEAEPDGLLAVGGDLRPERLVLAYSQGIFPWYDEGLPILWHSPDPRCVLVPERIRINRSLRKAVKRAPYRLALDEDFAHVIRHCAATPRPGQSGTWITQEMEDAYLQLFELGLAHCACAYDGERLVGGLYGVSLGAAFFGESMFSHAANASKIAFVLLVEQLRRWGMELVDCQVKTRYLMGFGAEMWARDRFVKALSVALQQPTRAGRWELEPAVRELIPGG